MPKIADRREPLNRADRQLARADARLAQASGQLVRAHNRLAQGSEQLAQWHERLAQEYAESHRPDAPERIARHRRAAEAARRRAETYRQQAHDLEGVEELRLDPLEELPP